MYCKKCTTTTHIVGEKGLVKAPGVYLNYKCPKCGKYFSLKSFDHNKFDISYQLCTIPTFDHGCNEKGEKIHYQLISHSVKPLKDAVKVLNEYD